MIIDSLKIVVARLREENADFANNGQLVEETKSFYSGKCEAFETILELIDQLQNAGSGESEDGVS